MDSKYIPPPKISDEHVATVQRSTNYVRALFEAIQNRHSEDTARKLFAPYGRALSKTDNRIRRDAALLWRLASMEKPNIKKLAREIAGKRGNADSMERRLKRIKRDSRVREYFEDQIEYLSYSQLDGELTNPYLEAGKVGLALSYLRIDDPPEE
jgi:hypothetical protein